MPQEFYEYNLEGCNRSIYENETIEAGINRTKPPKIFQVIDRFDEKEKAMEAYHNYVAANGNFIHYRLIRKHILANVKISNFARIKSYQPAKYYREKQWIK